uniref:Uncharacterized protein n=1 Tax=Anguilla anguilla TaxID=7936 RepID=A0A0E9PGT3_ANGAN
MRPINILSLIKLFLSCWQYYIKNFLLTTMKENNKCMTTQNTCLQIGSR